MRISDWSSDACSSDLCATEGKVSGTGRRYASRSDRRVPGSGGLRAGEIGGDPTRAGDRAQRRPHDRRGSRVLLGLCSLRSEEHTSELQSLMRISYAVFCLKQNTRETRLLTNWN